MRQKYVICAGLGVPKAAVGPLEALEDLLRLVLALRRAAQNVGGVSFRAGVDVGTCMGGVGP
jgi:class 3 adenylate cyclase